MRVPWRLVMWALIVALPIGSASIFLWLKTRDLSRYQNRLVEQVRKATGRELAARVPLHVVLGREVALVAGDVTLSNTSWASRPELAKVRQATMFLDPFRLLLGEAKVSHLVLEGADILVERNEAGDTNLEMLPPPDGSGPRPGDNRSLKIMPNPPFPWIALIDVRDSVLTIADGGGRPPVVLDIASGSLQATAANQTLQVEGRFGAPQAARLELAGTAGSFDGWIRGLPGNIDLQGSLGDGKISIKGSIGVKGTNLQIGAQGPDVAVFSPYIHVPLPSSGPYSLAAKASTLRGNLKIEVPSLKAGESEVSGDALFHPDRQGVPNVTVNIDAAKIDAAGLHAAPAAAPATADATPERRGFLPSMPFSVNWLGRPVVSVTVRVGEVSGLAEKVTNASITLVSTPTRYAFRAAATVGAGSAGFDLVYDSAGRNGQATFTATASHVSLAVLSRLLGVDAGLRDSVSDIDLRLRGAGRSTGDALAAASGSIDFAITKGSWPHDGLAGWPTETQRLLGGSDSAGVPFNCLAGRFEVSGGVAYLRRLAIDASRATLVGGGYIHPRSESWEVVLAPEARDPQGMALAQPLRLKGGTGRPTTGELEPALAKLLVGAGPVPSLSGTLNQLSRQAGVNACAALAPKVEVLRPGLRAQLPVPTSEVRGANRRPPQQGQKPKTGP
jgi:AsmA family protein